jgi:hypothetical protein
MSRASVNSPVAALTRAGLSSREVSGVSPRMNTAKCPVLVNGVPG